MSPTFFLPKLNLKTASRFENYVFQLLKKKFSSCAIIKQARLESGLVPDFVVECDRKLIVVEAKSKEFLQKSDIDQVIGYIQELDGDSALIYVADFTEVPDSIYDYAALNAVDIEHTNWRLSSNE